MHGTSGLFLEGFLPSSRDWGPGLQEGDTRILCMGKGIQGREWNEQYSCSCPQK